MRLALLLVLAACADAGDEPTSHDGVIDPEGAEDGTWKTLLTADDLIIRANVPVTTAQASRLADQLRDAFVFVCNELGGEPTFSPRLNVYVDSKQGAHAGWAYGDGTFDQIHISPSVLTTPRADDNVIAHELAHIWEVQNGGYTLPVYADEGRACEIGDTYNEVNGEPNVWLAPTRKFLAKLDEPTARQRLQAGNQATLPTEYTGQLWVEFLRTRYNDAGIPDVLARLGQASIATQNGMRWRAAFETSVGITLYDAREAFFAYIAATTGDAAERFRGTRWQ